MRLLEPGTTVSLGAQKCPRDGNVVRGDFEQLAKNALRGRPLGKGDNRRVVPIPARRIGPAFDRNYRAMDLVRRWCAFGFDVDEAAAWKIAAIDNAPRCPARSGVTSHELHWELRMRDPAAGAAASL